MLWVLIVLAYLLIFWTPMIVSIVHLKQGKKTGWIGRLCWMIFGTFLLVGLIIIRKIYPDVLLFQELGYVARYWTVFWAKWLFFIIGFLVSLVFFLLNVKCTKIGGLEEVESKEWESDKEERTDRIIIYYTAYILSVFIAFLIGLASIDFWDQYLRFKNQVPFLNTDPIFGKNIAFYVFSLPFLRMVGNYAGVTLIVAFLGMIGIYAGIYHYQSDRKKRHLVLNRAITHCSVLGIILVAFLVYTTKISIWNLMFSTRGAVFGAGWTDVNIQIGVYKTFIWVLGISGILFLVSAFAKSLKLTVWAAAAAMATWLIVWLFVVTLWPMVKQYYTVSPNELEYEKQYIQYNIAYTREAFGLTSEHLQVLPFPVATGDLTPQLLAKNSNTLENTRVVDWRPMEATFQQTQSFRLYYYFADMDVAAYKINGQVIQVMSSLRELEQNNLAAGSKTWQNRRIVYTHGKGVAISKVNKVTPEGLPAYLMKDIPPVTPYNELKISRDEIYYGELTKDFIYVKTAHPEFDYPGGDTNITCFYQGTGGIEIGSGLKKFILALRFDGIRLLTAQELKMNSRIMFCRSIYERVHRLATFLKYDRDPYGVVADGKIWFIWDAYTTTDDYPYSERHKERGPSSEGHKGQETSLNYIRNSVKVVIDAYNGKVDFYVFDPEDPIIRTYQKIFPGFFKSRDQMPSSLQALIRYPEDFLKIQADMYDVYHMSDPNVFYNKEDVYDIANESYRDSIQQVLPYYVVLENQFIQMIPFTPHTTKQDNPKNNMVAWMAGYCAGENYGKLLVYKFPKDRWILGPMQIEAKINQDKIISKDFSLWNQQGSQVIKGDLLVIPLSDNYIIYVKPIYLQSSVGKMPELKMVALAFGDKLAYAESFEAALMQLVEGTVGKETQSELNNLAKQYFENYQKLVGQGQMKEAGAELDKLGEVLKQLLK